MKIMYPDYENCIANLACSILKYYGITPPNGTLAAADRLLNMEYKNVVVILLDGMGVSIVNRHLGESGFFRKNTVCSYSSVFPPTTVAATTAIDSGLFPNQSGWLGWSGYFDEIDRNVVYFWNIDNDTAEKLTENAAWTYVPYDSIRNKISRTGVNAHYIAPFVEPFPKDYGSFCGSIKEICRGEGRQFIYAYWDDPDTAMHKVGVDDENITEKLRDIEKRTEELAERLSDTLLIITADHGHVNVGRRSLADHPDICKCLLRMPSMETRALNFFVKEGMKSEFEQAFSRHFGEDFILIPREKFLSAGLFGTGNNHPKLESMLGDYIGAAVGNTDISNTTPGKSKGNHAGLTDEEMIIPLIAVSC
ncbi:MAG: alkaline phosphatase family protein [Oscillospiraceae bacterium]|nr:alkaline phosphatase family protein [Oscillospiraceae bacterium]